MELLKRIETFLDDTPKVLKDLHESSDKHLESLQALPDGADKKEAMRTFGIVCDRIVKTIEVIQSVLKPNTP